jgi:hypothetical protein
MNDLNDMFSGNYEFALSQMSYEQKCSLFSNLTSIYASKFGKKATPGFMFDSKSIPKPETSITEALIKAKELIPNLKPDNFKLAAGFEQIASIDEFKKLITKALDNYIQLYQEIFKVEVYKSEKLKSDYIKDLTSQMEYYASQEIFDKAIFYRDKIKEVENHN